ncbi:MAG: methyltransferase domain-containing protein [Bacillota bacterium]|nr:methyltransferase domain-containing protein [Bacillota bacterium]
MTIFRPGEFTITDRAVELANFKKGSKLLDIGCGEGDTIAHLTEDLGMEAEGIEMNLAMISNAKEKHPGINIKFGDGEFLDDYMSFTFDGVLMECVLSLINIPDEALHEAYCVLKKGGKLIISDLYEKDPDPEKLKAVKIEAERLSKIPHKEGDCEEDPVRFVDFRLDGAFFKEPLMAQLEEIGYKVIAFEDRSADLDSYVVETMMQDGNLDDLLTNVKTEDAEGKKRKIGYFLLVAEKPE